MPADVSILQPEIMWQVIQKLPYPNSAVLSSALPRTPWPYPSVTWDVIKGSQNVAKPNMPNAEAHIISAVGVSQESASFIYTREKKVFEPTTLHWLKAPGTLNNIQNAEQAVLREMTDLNQRVDNYVELTCWRALSGTINVTYPSGATVTVDTKIPASHKPVPAVSWSTATPQQIIADVKAWKLLVARDGGVQATDAWLTTLTMDIIFNSWASYNTNFPGVLLTDAMRDSYYKTGTMPGFMGLDWHIVESFYTADAVPGGAYGTGNPTSFVNDNQLFITNLDDNRPMEIFEGPSADDEAPQGFTGKFTKTWQEKDPSARQILLEFYFMPVITRPESIVAISDVTA